MFDRVYRTQVIEDIYKCKWRLENFSQIPTLHDHSCPDFGLGNHEWLLKLCIKNGSVCIKLCESNSHRNLKVALKSQVTVVDSSETAIHSESKDFNTLPTHNKYTGRFEGYELFTMDEAILMAQEANMYKSTTRFEGYDLSFIDYDFLKEIAQSHNDTVIIIIELTISKLLTKNIKHAPDKHQLQEYAENSLCKDVLKMYDDNELTDVVLDVQGEKINAHKFILCARSSVFLKMFQQNMAESARNVVDIQDVGADAMKHLVDYMYSRVNDDYDFMTALDVYYAADKYQVPGLQKSCRKVLFGHIDENNAFQLLLLSDRHKDQVLKEGVMEYINFNFKFCAISEWWNDFAKEKSDLFQEFITFVNDKRALSDFI